MGLMISFKNVDTFLKTWFTHNSKSARKRIMKSVSKKTVFNDLYTIQLK